MTDKASCVNTLDWPKEEGSSAADVMSGGTAFIGAIEQSHINLHKDAFWPPRDDGCHVADFCIVGKFLHPFE